MSSPSQILAFIILMLPSLVTSAEIDTITLRTAEREDSLKRINDIVNSRIQEGVDRANESQDPFTASGKEKYCNEIILYRELRKAIFGSRTTSLGLKGYGLDRQFRELFTDHSISIPLEDSIYRDITYMEGFSLNLKELSDIVNINGHLIGLDKLGHFFAEGWSYFEMTSENGSTLEQAMQWGWDREEGRFGYTTTGIFSYADLVANFNGWRFWNRILQNTDDPLKGVLANFFTTPYVSCGVRIFDSFTSRSLVYGWALKKSFDLRDYLDGTWDERNNCVSYKNDTIAHKVRTRIQEIAPEFSCPAAPHECSMAAEKYGKYSKNLLHPSCIEVK